MIFKGISPQLYHTYLMSVTGFVNSFILEDMKMSRKRGSDKSEQKEEEE